MTPLDHSTDLPCPSVQALLSEYMDGRLSSEEHQSVQGHLGQCPACVEFMADLRSAQAGVSALQHTMPLPPEMNGLWTKLQQQLSQDQAEHPASALCSYDVEFISAYYDGELSQTDPHFERFEAHLSTCSACNQQLGNLQEVSHQYQAWVNRLEAACSFTVTETVMTQLQVSPTCSQYDMETLSAFYDEALSAKETMTLSLHLEQCEACHRQLQAFHQLSEQFQGTLQEPELADLNLWPAVATRLANDAIFQKRQKRRFFNQPKVAIPAAAAAVFLCVLFSMNPLTPSPDPNALFQNQVAALTPQGSGPAAFDADPSSFSPAHEENAQVALHPEATGVTSTHRSINPETAPTAEEYLFQQSHQELPDEELPLILGVGRP